MGANACFSMPVAVTGIGLVTPLGLCSAMNLERCRKGASGIGPMRRFDVAGHAACSAEVAEFDLEDSLQLAKNYKYMTPAVRCAAKAAQEAVEQSGLRLEDVEPERIALCTGSGQTGLEHEEFFRALSLAWAGDRAEDYSHLGGRASRLIDPYFSLRTLSNIGIALLSAELGVRGPSANFVHSDTAAAAALQAACYDLTEDRCDVALVGGYDSLLRASVFLSYERAGFLSHSNPDVAYRPFDVDRDGLVLGEGAAVLLLERWDDARARHATILGKIAGIGCTMHADDLSACSFAGAPLRQAVGDLLNETDKLDFVVARGIGTQEGDRAESAALGSLVGPDVPVTSLKSSTGYLGAATAAVEVALGLLCARERFLPAIARCATRDAECSLNLVMSSPRELESDHPAGLFVFQSWGGQTAALLASAVRD